MGDSFPDDEKLEHVRSRLVPGAIIHRHCDFTNPPKPKFLLVASVKAETTVFVINSEIHPFIEARPHLLACQVPIDKKSHTFLRHDSHIDCTEPADYLDTGELAKELVANLDGLKGCITNEVRLGVLQAIQNSYTMPENEKPALIASLSDPQD